MPLVVDFKEVLGLPTEEGLFDQALERAAGTIVEEIRPGVPVKTGALKASGFF